MLRRRALIIVLTTLLVAGAAAAFAYLSRSKYQTTAELLFSQTIGTEQDALGLIPTTVNADKLAADNAAFVGSRRVASLTAQRLGDGTSADSVQKDVTVPLPKTSDVVSVVATAPSRQRAAQLANRYAASAIELARQDQARRTQELVKGLDAQLRQLRPGDPVASGLRARIAQVAALGSSGTGVPQLIQEGFQPAHKTGKPLQTVLLGVLLGALLGVGLALLREQSDRRLRRPEDVSAAFDAPVLATIPKSSALARHLAFDKLPPDVAESFFMLQSNLRYGRRGGPVRSLLVTSSRGRQGKTTVSWNMALAAASAGLSVALIDADLRRSSLAGEHGLRSFPGLAEVLRGDVSAADAVQHASTSSDDVAQNGHAKALTVLVAGGRPPDPSALMQSQYMATVLDEFIRNYDLVIVDTPPIAHVADAISLLRHVDGVLVVASVHATQGSEAARLREQLQALDAPLVGVVANGGSSTGAYVSESPQAV